jgi:hypothetical protein
MCSCAGLTAEGRGCVNKARDHREKTWLGLTLYEPIASGAKKVDTLLSDTIPIPFEHLGDNNWSPPATDERLYGVIE